MKDSRKRQTLRTFAVTLSGLFALLCVCAAATGAAQGLREERIFEDKIPSHVGVKVKAKNHQNEKWVRDLEVEVKNTGSKPIYYMKLILLLPESKSPNGSQMGFAFRYGRREMVDIGEHATPEDKPLAPGESYTFKIEEKLVKGWERFESEYPEQKAKRFTLILGVINFGDGTGFVDTSGTAVPSRRASRAPCGEKVAVGVAGMTATDPPMNRLLRRSNHSPVSFLPANFLPGKASGPNPAAAPSDGFCCNGSGCSHIQEVRNGYTCQCGEADSIRPVSCDVKVNTGCGKTGSWQFTCDDDQGNILYCTQFFRLPCDSMDIQ